MRSSKNLIKVLTPSWSVTVFALTFGILLIGATIALTQFENSELSQQVFAVQSRQQSESQSTGSVYETITNTMTQNDFLNTVPLLLLWAAVGLGVYYLALSAYKVFSQAATLKEQLGYVHMSRQTLIKQEAARLAVRVGALIAFVLLLRVTISVVIPYVMAIAHIAARDVSVVSGAYVVLGLAVVYVAVWFNTIALRLIVLKTRLLG